MAKRKVYAVATGKHGIKRICADSREDAVAAAREAKQGTPERVPIRKAGNGIELSGLSSLGTVLAALQRGQHSEVTEALRSKLA